MTDLDIDALRMLCDPPAQRDVPKSFRRITSTELDKIFAGLKRRKLTMQDERGTWHTTDAGRKVLEERERE